MADSDGDRAGWNALLDHLRVEVTRSGRWARIARDREEAELLQWAREVDGDLRHKSACRIQGLWQVLRAKKGGGGMSTLLRGDDPSGERVHCSSDEFLPELGGDTFVWACSEPGAASVGAAPERLLGSLSQAALGSVVWSPAEVGGAGGVRQWSGGAWRAVSAA